MKNECKAATVIAKHIETRNTRMLKEKIEPKTCQRNSGAQFEN